MAMNRKGQTALIGLVIGVFLFMFAMSIIDPLADVISETRTVGQLDCDNNSITDGKKATCLIVDLMLPYFIAIVLAVAGGYIGARFIIG